MGILSRLGIVTETRSEPVIEPTPAPTIPSRYAGPVTSDTALSIPTAYRAVSVIATSAMQLVPEVRKSGQLITSPSLINQPNVHESRSAFLKRTVTSLALNGNAYWLKTFNNRGEVANLEPLNALAMAPAVIKGARVYVYAGDEFRTAATYQASEIAHLKLLEANGLRGLGPIQACYQAVRGVLDLRAYADNWFATTAHPIDGILSTPDHLLPEQTKHYQEAWAEFLKSGGVAVLGNGLKYDHAWLDPESAQFLESQKFSVNEIGRLFGVPSSMLNSGIDGNSMTYATIQDLNRAFLSQTLMAYLIEIEAALSFCLPRGQEVKFSFADWLRPDPKTQAEIDASLTSAGILTVDEVRASRGLPPIDPGVTP